MPRDLSTFTPRPRPERRVLEGRYCRLEPLNPARHGDELFAASMAPGAEARHRFLFEAPMERAEFQDWLGQKAASEDPLFFAVIDKATGRCEGRQTLMRIDPTHGCIEIGSILWGPAISRSRVATEANYLFAAYAFDTLGYRRYEWKCHNLNAPSKRAATRFGFTYEGLFRQHMVAKGGNRDTAWFAMIDADWPLIKAAYEAWLDPANFDAGGGQKKKLQDFFPLRRAGLGELVALVDLQRAAYAPNRAILGVEPIPLQADYAEIVTGMECWLAGEPAKPDGALILDVTGADCLIWSVAVAPAAQGRGIAKRLMAFAEDRARLHGAAKLTLYTGEKLEGNIALYKRLGYAISRVEMLSDRNIVHMEKPVQPA